MIDALHDWLVAWADSDAGPAALFGLSAAESVFFPLPPDPLLIALGLRHPVNALWYALITTAGSVLGALIGHWLGRRFGRPLLERLHAKYLDRVEALFVRHGFAAIFIAALTPIPYKVFTIAAGAFGISRTPFLIASIVGRGARFFLVGALIFIWGDRFQTFLDERFDLVMMAMGLMVIAAIFVWYGWSKYNGRGTTEIAK
ncbi:MAG: YqaA family protein [Dehalococcoidia bacterium]